MPTGHNRNLSKATFGAISSLVQKRKYHDREVAELVGALGLGEEVKTMDVWRIRKKARIAAVGPKGGKRFSATGMGSRLDKDTYNRVVDLIMKKKTLPQISRLISSDKKRVSHSTLRRIKQDRAEALKAQEKTSVTLGHKYPKTLAGLFNRIARNPSALAVG